MFLIHKVKDGRYNRIGFNYSLPTKWEPSTNYLKSDFNRTIIESVLLLPLPIILYQKWLDFDTNKQMKGLRYLRLSIYFRIRNKNSFPVGTKRFILDAMFNLEPFYVKPRIKRELN